MQVVPSDLVFLALFNVGGGEIILVLALVLILFGAKKLPELARGLGSGIDHFGKSCRDVTRELDDTAADSGESLGGIYGKKSVQAITADNQVAELYSPAVFGERPFRRRKPLKICQAIARWLLNQLQAAKAMLTVRRRAP
jgi:sec-independent protein translocase protein TatA